MTDHSKLIGSKGEGDSASLLEGKEEEGKALLDRMLFISDLISKVSLGFK